MKPSAWWPRIAGIGAFLAVLAVGFWPAGTTVAASGPAGLPDRFAEYSYLTGNVSAAPPGRAMAIWQHGFGVETFDFPQAGLLGADGDLYRRVDAAESRSGAESQGDPAPMRLSPDGTRIAVGAYSLTEPDLVLVDLATGEARSHPVPGGHSALPLAWSPDSSRVVYLTTPEPIAPYSGTGISGELGVLDVVAGSATLMPGPGNARAVAFSPDGAEIAIHRITPDDGTLSGQDGIPRMGGGVIDVVDLDGEQLRQIPVPDQHYLDGPNSWSADGAVLALAAEWIPPCDDLDPNDYAWAECFNSYTGPEHGMTFLDATGAQGPVPEPLAVEAIGADSPLGWTGAGEMLLFLPEDPDNWDSELYWLTAVPLTGGEPHRLSAVPVGPNFGVGGLQVATTLLPDVEIRPAGHADRGRWPLWLRVTAAVAAGGLAMLVTAGGMRWSTRRARSRADRLV